MGKHTRPGDPPQNAVETVELPAVGEVPPPPRSGRHRGTERAARSWWPKGVSQGGDHEGRARGHRPAPVALHVTVGAITTFALLTSWGVLSVRSELDTVRPDPAPLQGRFETAPSPASGSAPVTSGPVVRKTGRATTSPRPVTRGTPRPTTSQSLSGGAPERPRRTGTPSASPSPGGGGTSPAVTTPPASDPTTQAPVLDVPGWDCPWGPK